MPERMERRQRSQQPGAGAAAVPGVMERGQRRGPLSECVPGLHGGRAAGATERKRPAPLLRGGCAWAGVPGLPAWQGRHAAGSFPVSEPQRACFIRFAAASPARRCDRGSTCPMGQLLAACCCLRGAPRGFRSEAALYKGPLTLPRRGG